MTLPNTTNVPVLVTGPSRLTVATPAVEGSAVRVPSLSSPDVTARVAPPAPGSEVPPVPTVSELPFAMVSSPRTTGALWSTTVVSPGMQASTAVESGTTPALQLLAVP